MRMADVMCVRLPAPGCRWACNARRGSARTRGSWHLPRGSNANSRGAAGQPNSIGGSRGAGGPRSDRRRHGLCGDLFLAPSRQNFLGIAIGLLAALEHEIAGGLERDVALRIAFQAACDLV